MSSAIFKSHPDLQKGLAKETIEALGVSNKEAFKKEIEYLQAINAVFDVLYNYNESCSSVRSAINNPKNNDKNETLVNVQGMVSLSQGYHQLYQYGLQLVRDRLSSNKSQNILEPRIERLGKKLNLTEKETYAMTYVILSNAQMLTHRYGRGFDFPEMAQACDMNIIEAMAFFSPSRVHVKEAIISPDAEDPHSYGFKVPYTTCTVLAGLPLSEETLLKIDKTLLAEVLLEENNEEYSMLSVGTTEERRDKLKKSNSTDFDSLFSKLNNDSDEDKKSEKDDNDDFKFDDDEDKKEEEEEPKDIFEMVRDEIQKEKEKPVEEEDESKSEETDKQKMQPYTTNTAYLSDHIEWLYVLIRVKLMIQENMSEMSKDVEKETQIRELKAKERMLRTKCEKKLAATLEPNKWIPRLEKLVTHLQLSHFEKMVLLVLTANVLSPKISPDDSRYNSRVSNFTVGNLMGLFTDSFEQEIEYRKYFYKNATLVKQGIVSLESSYRNNELMNVEVELDRRMLDFVVGLDTEFSELVEGSHLYHSTVKLDKVVLPEKQKADIVQAVKNFEQFQKAKKKLGLEEFLAYGSGLVLLFHGKSGTGKTMMANAIANMLDKRILLINFPSLGSRDSDVLIKFIFREAKLTDSIIFFDECESIFQSRDRSDSSVNLLLTELEMHNQLVIMATNRAFDLDEAMHRRINHAVEFQVPNPRLRNQIWQAHLPNSVTLDKDVNLQDLAIRFELSGGFIKNSIVSALSSAVSRNPSAPVVSMSDLTAGAEYQLRARLKMTEFDGRVVPDHGLDDLITTAEVKQKIRKIIRVEKARQVLYSEWGYSDKGANAQGTSVLFYGPPGSGKTHAAEAIGFEVGKPLKIENARNSYHKSDFESAAEHDAIFVLDNAGSLFKKPTTEDGKKVEQTEHLDLLYHMDKFHGITIVIANSLENVEPTFLKGFKFVVEFQLPTAESREVLWKKLLPPFAPVASDVDFKALATKYNFSGGNIKNACFQAAAVAALRLEETEQSIRMKDLLEAAEDESGNPLPEAVVYV